MGLTAVGLGWQEQYNPVQTLYLEASAALTEVALLALAEGVAGYSSSAPKGKMPSADAQQIAKGHAWSKHKDEFPEFLTEGEFAQQIDQIMANPSASKNLTKGRTAFWDDKTQTVVIRDPNSPDLGTAFRPKNGKAYYDNLK